MRFCSPRRPRVDVFASVPAPGHPLGLAIDGATVYVSTHHDINGGPGVPSHVFAYDAHGEITADLTISGQAATGQGAAGMALDHDGVLYIVDQAPARVVALDPRTGEQWLYAELPDVPPCGDSGPDGGCSQSPVNRPAAPINCCFGPTGHLYVGDLMQALIWRIPPGGGSAEVWYTAADLDSLFGCNTIRFLDWGRTLLVADSAHNLQDVADLQTARGRLYTLTIESDGSPGTRKLLWEGSSPGDTPDGVCVGASGNIYAALAVGNAVAVIAPDGREITRVPADPQQNAKLAVPFDLPGGTAFYGDRLLVTNQVFLGGDTSHEVIFSVDVHERGRDLFRPCIPRRQ